MSSVTDAKDTVTSYTYHAQNDRMTHAESGDVYVDYTYDKDRLSTITHNEGQVQYTFEYDVYGRSANTRVGNGTANQRLATYSYTNRHLMSLLQYGNGDTVHYTYNNNDLVSSKWFDDSAQKVYYDYNSDSQLGLVRDEIQNTRTRYTYDLAGRLIKEEVLPHAQSKQFPQCRHRVFLPSGNRFGQNYYAAGHCDAGGRCYPIYL